MHIWKARPRSASAALFAFAQQSEFFYVCRRAARESPLRPPPDGCRRIRDLECSLCEECGALRKSEALYRRVAFRRFEQTLFPQHRVFPAQRKQLLMGSALEDTAVIKHENLVGV